MKKYIVNFMSEHFEITIIIMLFILSFFMIALFAAMIFGIPMLVDYLLF